MAGRRLSPEKKAEIAAEEAQKRAEVAARRAEARARQRLALVRFRRALKWYLLAGIILLEIGLRFVLGNFAQSRLLHHSDHLDVCLETRPDFDMLYTGWMLRVPPTRMRTNSLGARGNEIAATRPEGALRVLHLGDSFTFGQGVEESEAFSRIVADELEDDGFTIETLNFGVPGHGTPQSVALLEHKLLNLKPDVVLLHVFANDLSAEDSYCLRGPRQGKSRTQRWLLQNVYLARLVAIMTSPFRQVATPADVAVLGSPEERYVEAIERAGELATEHGFLFGVVLLTDQTMFTDSPYCRDCSAPHSLKPRGPAHFIDMSDTWLALQRDVPLNFITGEGHLTAAGNQTMGIGIAHRMRSWVPFEELARERSKP
jgi:hypothetical protein